MEIRALTETYAVSPQITPEDVPAIVAAGYKTVICNRPDDEIPPMLRADRIREAVEAAGLTFVEIPVSSRMMSHDDIRQHRDSVEASEGPVLAYCASGTRSTIIWMMGAARTTPPEDLIAAATNAGYPLAGMLEQLEVAAKTV